MTRKTFLVAVLCFLGVTFAVTTFHAQEKNVDVAGTWNVTIHTTTEGTVMEQWVLKQEGDNVTGMAKTKKGEAPVKAKVLGTVVRGLVTQGTDNHQVHVTVHEKDFDGTIRVGRNVWLIMAKKAS